MGYCVYEMPAVREANFQYRPSIEDLRRRLETTDPRAYHQFLPYLEALGQNWFKKRYDKFRLVAKLWPVEVGGRIAPVVVFVDFLPRADRAYGDGTAQYFEQRYAGLLQAREPAIRELIQEQLRKSAPVFKPPPPPPEELHTLLHPLRPRERADAFFVHGNFSRAYERLTSRSERGDIERAKIMEAVYQALQAIENAQGEPPNELRRRTCSYDDDRVVTVYYTRLQEPEQGFRHVLLLDLVDESAADKATQLKNVESAWQQAHEHLFRELAQQGNKRERSSTRYWDALSQLAERAFPSYLLAGDYKLWENLWDTEQREVFLALSSEEIYTLESLLSECQLPAVIEGRAGSGKSTLLIYYTAERLAQSSVSSVQALFLTQSEGLLKKAKELIVNLRERLCQEYGEHGNMEMAFRTYHEFALDQLPAGRRERFADRSRRGGWLDFAQFSELLRGHGPESDIFRHSFGRSRDCNPETVWFILRSYIKGYKIGERGEDRWMSPDEYEEELPAGDRQVSVELYRQVWDCVWPWYKRLTVPSRENDEDPPYWDDLDLAWEVLEHRRRDAPTYAVLICDEVQDLTRVELASLLAALVWTRYDLAELVRQYRSLPLPIILAGDAHQTINPSCFRWQRVSADLAQALVQHLPHLQRPSINRLELAYNYRNAQSIAQLCNAVQYLRQHTLGVSSRLQELWRQRDNQPNQRIRRLVLRPDNRDLQRLLDEGVLAIGPVEDDPELEGARAFWQAFGFSEPPNDHPNYVTPAEIKGLEQDYVAVVGFGVLFDKLGLSDLWNWEDGKDATSKMPISEARRFLAEFFLNRLYVAISRAREQLWILETEEGWRSFWQPLFNWWQCHQVAGDKRVISYRDGDLAEVIGVFKGRWLPLAEEFEKLAHDQHSPEHAERSAYYYLRCDRRSDAERMQAWKFYYEGKTLEAARAMQDIDKNRASDWFWEAAADQPEAWQELRQPWIRPDWRRVTAQRYLELQTNRTSHQLKELVEHLVGSQEVIHKAQSPPKAWRTWEQLLLYTLEQSLSLPDVPDTLKESAYQLGKSLCPQDAIARQYKRWQELLAQLIFNLAKSSPVAHNYYGPAAQHWENAGNTEHRDYYIAKAESSGYPGCLRWWESAGELDRVLEEYRSHPNIALARDEAQRVVRALREKWKPRIDQTVREAIQAGQNLAESLACLQAAGALVRYLAGQNLAESLAEVIRGAHQELRKLYIGYKDAVPDLPRFEPEWTNWILDLLISYDNEVARLVPEPVREKTFGQIIRGLVLESFALDCEPAVLRHRLRESWDTRAHAHTNWPRFRNYLQQVVRCVHEIVKTRAGDQNRENRLQVARLCRFVLGITWQFERRERSERDDFPPHWRSRLPDYFTLPETEARATVNYLEQIRQELRTTVQEAIACIADLPEDWIRSGEAQRVDEPWRSLLEWVSALAYDFCDNLRLTLTAAQTEADVALFDWWMLLGRFIEQEAFRRRALDFYRDLLKLSEKYNWPHERKELVRQRLQDYEARYNRWARQRGEQRQEREGRALIHVNAGDRKRGDFLEVTSMDNRPEALIKFMPDEYQVRFWPSGQTESNPHMRPDPEVTITGPEVIAGSLRWRLTCKTSEGEKSAELEWKGGPDLCVRGDRAEFVVQFAAPAVS